MYQSNVLGATSSKVIVKKKKQTTYAASHYDKLLSWKCIASNDILLNTYIPLDYVETCYPGTIYIIPFFFFFQKNNTK